METARAERIHNPIKRIIGAAASALLVLTTLNPSGEAKAQTSARTETLSDPGCAPGEDVTHGKSGMPWVAVTLDDGPGNEASAMMDVFDANGASGNLTEFLVGDQIRAHPDLAKEIAARTKDVGNHSETHPNSASAIAAQMAPNQITIRDYMGITPKYARPPYLIRGANINAAEAAEGLCNVLISLDSRDSAASFVPESQVCANFRLMKADDNILIHDFKPETRKAVQNCLFPILNEKGLIAVSLHELLTGVLDNDTRIPAGGHVEILAGAPGQTVIGQLTVDGARGPGYLVAYPCLEGKPPTSNLNYVRGEPNSNVVYSKLDAEGKLCIANYGAATNIIFDRTAEVPGLLLPVHNGIRFYDSRGGLAQLPSRGKLIGGEVLRLKLSEASQAVIAQVTSDVSEKPGFITAYNCDLPQPPTSSLNYVPGRAASNTVLAQASTDGELCLYSSSTTDVIVDEFAAFDPEPAGISFDPARLIDTRITGAALADGGSISLAAGQPNKTIIGQLTVDREKGSGFTVIYPCGPVPTASNINYNATRPRSSSVVAKADGNGNDCVYVSKGTDVIFDKVAEADWPSHAPERLLDTRQV